MRADAKHLMERQVYEYDLTTFVHKPKAIKTDLKKTNQLTLTVTLKFK